MNTLASSTMSTSSGYTGIRNDSFDMHDTYTALQPEHNELASFYMYARSKPKRTDAFSYAFGIGRLRDEVEGLQAGINCLEKFEPFDLSFDLRAEAQSASSCNISKRPHPADSDTKTLTWDPLGFHPAWRKTSAEGALQRHDSSVCPENLCSIPTPPSEDPKSPSYLFGPSTFPSHQNHEQHYGEIKTDDSKKKTKKLPQANQWATLRDLRLSSRLQYLKFLRLTSKSESRGIKKLRKLYGGAGEMLETGIMTFGNVLDGQEPGSLKEVFAFTCLSYVMLKILKKLGRMESSHALAETSLWRSAIRNEKDRFIYDEVVKIIWPEVEYLTTHSQAASVSSTPIIPELRQDGVMANDLSLDSDATGFGNSFSSMMAYGMAASSEFNLLDRARSVSSTSITGHCEFDPDDQDSGLVPVDQRNRHGYQGHTIELLRETSTSEDASFADFLNLGGTMWDGSVSDAHVKQPLVTPSAGWPPDSSPQIFQHEQPVETINPKQLCHSYAQPETDYVKSLASSVTKPEGLLPEMALSSKPFDSGRPPTFPEYLVGTVMFQVVVEFVKFVGSLGDLLYHLSGCGITTRRNKLEPEDYSRPGRGSSCFTERATKLIFEPIKAASGRGDGSLDAVLDMADTFVRLDRLQTVREIEEYIITVSRYVTCGYDSFVTLVSKTLKQCLFASTQMNWDHTYACYLDDPEEYSSPYIERRKAEEIAWALDNLKTQNKSEFTSLESTTVAERNLAQLESCLPSTSDSSPKKKQNSLPKTRSTMVSSSKPGSEPSTAPCQCPKCDKSYKGKEARVNLRRHIRTEHEDRKPIKCPSCRQESSRKDNMRKHFLLRHRGEKMPEILSCRAWA